MKQSLGAALLAALLVTTGVEAQGQTPVKVDVAILLEFENRAGAPGESLTRLATDAVAVELAATNRYEVLRRDEVNRNIKELGLRTPLDANARRRLAQALGATVIVDGAIEFIKDDVKAKPRSVSVGLTVRVSEVATGELIAGAAQVGVSRAGPGASDTHTLATEALRSAAITAPRAAMAQSVPEGIVMSSNSFGRARVRIINRGANHGVKKGMKLMVLRDGIRIGTVEAVNIFPQHTEVKVTDGDEGIRTEDRVRAIGQIVGKLK